MEIRIRKAAGQLLIIHLGAHKTASTHIQTSLRAVRPQLQKAGLFYAGPHLLRSNIPFSDALVRGGNAGAAATCAAWLGERRKSFPHMLLSEENILGATKRASLMSRFRGIYPQAAPRLAQVIDMAGGGPATVYLALRDPASFLVSAFALQLQQGREVDIRDYLRGRGPAQVRWSGLVRRLSRLEQVERIVVWRYEDYRDLRPRLFDHMLPDGLGALVPEIAPANVSITQSGYEWFSGRAMEDVETDLSEIAHEAQRRFPRSEGHPPLRLLTDAEYALSARCYGTEIAAVRALPKVEFLDP